MRMLAQLICYHLTFFIIHRTNLQQFPQFDEEFSVDRGTRPLALPGLLLWESQVTPPVLPPARVEEAAKVESQARSVGRLADRHSVVTVGGDLGQLGEDNHYPFLAGSAKYYHVL